MELMLLLEIFLGSTLAGGLMACVALRLLAILQQEGYSGKGLIKWCFRKEGIQRRRLSLLALSLALLTAFFSLCFSFAGYEIANLLAAVPFVGMSVLYLISERKFALKVPARRTPRFVRLSSMHLLLVIALSFGIGVGMAAASIAVDKTWFYLLRFVPYAVLPLILPLTVACANAVMELYEIPHGRKFVRRAKSAIDGATCVKVGITGSFGKTSVKHFAAAILSSKYRVIATPASYNTPMGIARAVNEGGLDCDVFLAEMGARHVGDIAELCDMVNPTVGVVTGVSEQHLETFGSLENIAAEKGVLAARTEKKVLGATVTGSYENALVEGVDFAAEDVEVTGEGTNFTLRIGEKTSPISTKLLGRHTAEDIALAAALCSILDMEFEEITAGIGMIEPVPHRLQRIEGNGAVILDDSYNSNVAGARDAVEVLRASGGKKFVVTPGLVELGELEEEKNVELGASLAGIDRVILVGETLVLPVRRGYLDAGGDEEVLTVVPTLEKAQKILAEELSAGDTVLFLNDLPDKYL